MRGILRSSHIWSPSLDSTGVCESHWEPLFCWLLITLFWEWEILGILWWQTGLRIWPYHGIGLGPPCFDVGSVPSLGISTWRWYDQKKQKPDLLCGITQLWFYIIWCLWRGWLLVTMKSNKNTKILPCFCFHVLRAHAKQNVFKGIAYSFTHTFIVAHYLKLKMHGRWE